MAVPTKWSAHAVYFAMAFSLCLAPAAMAAEGESFTNSIGMALVWIPKDAQNGGFYIGQYEVTQAEYVKVTASNNPAMFKGDRRPVEQVTWKDAGEFTQKLTAVERAAKKLPEGFVYALPTEQQWQYAAADATIEQAVCSVAERRKSTADVGTLKPNKFGLYDMLGNVWEWCQDWSGDERTLRILCGGSWLNDVPSTVSVSYRLRTLGVGGANNQGFRCVLVSESSSASP